MSSFLWYVWPLGNLHDAWPQIHPNLVASTLCFVVGYVVGLRRWFKKIHRHVDHLHDKVDGLHGKIDQLPSNGSTTTSNEVR